MTCRKCLGAFVVIVALASTAKAAPILNGTILIGATNVNVGGTLYNVDFVDGSCVTLFTGCNELSDFTFTTSGAAEVASQALLDQVFVDGPSGDFDSNPNLTFGCGLLGTHCQVMTPYFADVFVWVASAINESLSDYVLLHAFGLNIDVGGPGPGETVVYARWTSAAVPEPASLTLLGLGLAGIVARRWRQRKQ